MKKIKLYVLTIAVTTCLISFVSTNYVSSTEQKGSTDLTTSNSIKDPLAGDTGGVVSIETLVARIINAILGIVGSLALLMFVYGGLTWMTAAGASDKVQKGKDILIWATIGLVVIFTSYALVTFIIKAIAGTA